MIVTKLLTRYVEAMRWVVVTEVSIRKQVTRGARAGHLGIMTPRVYLSRDCQQ